MNWSSFKYLVKQGWHNMVANRLMTVASLGVLTACLVITGIAGILSVSVSNFVQSLGDKDMIEVFISDEATDEQIEAWSQQLPQLANVASCTFISKAQAVEDMKAEMGEYADVLQDYEGEGNEANPLPASFRIYVTDIALLNDTVAAIQQVGGDLFYRINSPTELGDILVQMRRVVNIAGWGLVAVLGIVSVVIISNTIRLTVFARRREINIMKFVGATNAFIRMPFFVEGMTVGALAGLFTGVVHVRLKVRDLLAGRPWHSPAPCGWMNLPNACTRSAWLFCRWPASLSCSACSLALPGARSASANI